MPRAHPPHGSAGWHLCLPTSCSGGSRPGCGWRERTWGLLLARFLVLVALPAGSPLLQPQPLDQPGATLLPEPASRCPVGGPGTRTASTLSLEVRAQLVGSELASLQPVAVLPTPRLSPCSCSYWLCHLSMPCWLSLSPNSVEPLPQVTLSLLCAFQKGPLLMPVSWSRGFSPAPSPHSAPSLTKPLPGPPERPSSAVLSASPSWFHIGVSPAGTALPSACAS